MRRDMREVEVGDLVCVARWIMGLSPFTQHDQCGKVSLCLCNSYFMDGYFSWSQSVSQRYYLHSLSAHQSDILSRRAQVAQLLSDSITDLIDAI